MKIYIAQEFEIIDLFIHEGCANLAADKNWLAERIEEDLQNKLYLPTLFVLSPDEGGLDRFTITTDKKRFTAERVPRRRPVRRSWEIQ